MEVKPISMYEEREFLKENSNVKKGDIVFATAVQFIEPILFCDVNGRDALMFVEDIDDSDYKTKKLRTAKALVGKKLLARVLRIENEMIILERRTVIKDTCEYLKNNVGKIIECTVNSIAYCGIFVDIGNGLVSLIPNVEISKSRCYDWSLYFNYDNVLKVKILNYDTENGVFHLSRKGAYDVMTEETLPRGSVIIVSVHKYVDEAKSGVYVEYDPANTGIMDIPDGVKPDKFYETRRAVAIVKTVKPQKGIKVVFSKFV